MTHAPIITGTQKDNKPYTVSVGSTVKEASTIDYGDILRWHVRAISRSMVILENQATMEEITMTRDDLVTNLNNGLEVEKEIK